ncbi:YczE/YyaS/YitT family protein [Agathobaculum sp. TL06]
MPQRVALYIAGLLSMAVGVVLSIKAGLGISPFDSMCYAFSTVCGVELSNMLNIVFMACIGIQAFILRHEFQLMNLTQIIWSLVFSYFIELTEWIMEEVIFTSYPIRLVVLAISISLIALGIELYTNVGLIPMPSDGLVLCLCHSLGGVPYHKVKIVFDCTAVCIGVVVAVLTTGQVVGVREGTVLTAIMLGPTTRILRRPALQFIHAICRGSETSAMISRNCGE